MRRGKSLVVSKEVSDRLLYLNFAYSGSSVIKIIRECSVGRLFSMGEVRVSYLMCVFLVCPCNGLCELVFVGVSASVWLSMGVGVCLSVCVCVRLNV